MKLAFQTKDDIKKAKLSSHISNLSQFLNIWALCHSSVLAAEHKDYKVFFSFSALLFWRKLIYIAKCLDNHCDCHYMIESRSYAIIIALIQEKSTLKERKHS